MVAWYRMFDSDPHGVIDLDMRDAGDWNRKGWGIFWSVNDFDGARRIENLTRINAWAVDMDEGEKPEQWQRIKKSPLTPSHVVETKRGFQVYWRAKDPKAKHWNSLVLDRLVPWFGADKNARDLARILRVPGYLHQKDPTSPFKVRTVHVKDVAYSEQDIADHFPDSGKEARDRAVHERARKEIRDAHDNAGGGGDDFWERVYNLDCFVGLSRLSGHASVRCERYSFKENRSGTRNIVVDDKATSTWVDSSGRIGSLSKGGPTLYQWLRWYGNSPSDCARVLKDMFPELETR